MVSWYSIKTMGVKPSFKALLNEILATRGFTMRSHNHWYKLLGNALIVVSLHRKSYDRGVYIEYGLTFLDISRKRYPKTDECVLFGDNPAMPQDVFRNHQKVLSDIAEVRRNYQLQREVAAGVDTQLKALTEWSDRAKLVQRVRSRKPLEMLVNRPDLGLPL